MKSKYVLLASALLISVSTFAQKDQIKAAEKALKSGNSAEAKSILQQAESLIANAADAEKAQYFFVKGNTLVDLATKNIDATKNQLEAAKAFQELIDVEKISGKSKYTNQAQTSITDIKGKILNSAVEDGTNKKFDEASKKLYIVYELDKTDLEKLYYAASYAVNAQDYDTALAYYEELKSKNYSGEGMAYYAKNLLSEKEDFFGTTAEAKTERDNKVKLKVYSNPRDEKIPSKRGEIYKNIALILLQKDKTEQAKTALSDARKANPDDTSLIISEADLYLKLQDFEKYKKLVSEVLEKDPNNPELLFNLGVVSSKTDAASAETYYKKAIELKPDYVNAYLNLSILKLEGETKIVDEINKLGTSEKDNKRYEVLKKQREDIFKSALPYLEKANELDPKNEDVAATLLNVYGALEMTDKKKALKAKMGNYQNSSSVSNNNNLTGKSNIIKLNKKDGGTFEIPCKINDIPMKLIFDTGASDVSISLTEANFMLKNGQLLETDIIGKQNYKIANGAIEEGYIIVIRKLEFGDYTLTDIKASVSKSLHAPLLLGQSALSKLGKITIDYDKDLLIIGK